MGFINFIRSIFRRRSRKPLPGYIMRFSDGDFENMRETMVFRFTPPKERYIIKSGSEYFVYSSKSEMPEHIRSGVEKMETSREATSSIMLIVDGERSDFADIDDIPEDIRKAMESVQA